jgi:uncharacterized protein (TIGR04255 family)
MTKHPTLNSTPIKEIIIVLSYSGETSIGDLVKFSESSLIQETLPIRRTAMNTKIDLSSVDTSKPTTGQEGFILQDSEEPNRVLQARIGSLTFHCINQYTAFDNLIAECKTYWQQFASSVQDISITDISIRYVNFFDVGPSAEISQYLKLYVEHPFEVDNCNGFCDLGYTKDSISVRLISSKAQIKDKEGIVFDYSLNKNIGTKDAFKELESLRTLKNDIFFAVTRKKTLKPYMQ